MRKAAIGEREVEVLRFVAEHAPVSAREVAEQFGEPEGLARTTVVTLMERLRKKGFLTRRRKEGIYRYTPRVPEAEVAQGLVRQFVEKMLGGSVSPVFAYLTQTRRLSEEEVDELQQLIDAMRAQGEHRS